MLIDFLSLDNNNGVIPVTFISGKNKTKKDGWLNADYKIELLSPYYYNAKCVEEFCEDEDYADFTKEYSYLEIDDDMDAIEQLNKIIHSAAGMWATIGKKEKLLLVISDLPNEFLVRSLMFDKLVVNGFYVELAEAYMTTYNPPLGASDFAEWKEDSSCYEIYMELKIAESASLIKRSLVL